MFEQSAIASPATIPSSPTTGYFAVIDGRRLGPLSPTELAKAGLTAESWVVHPESADWQRAEQVAELQQLLLAPPPFPTATPVKESATPVVAVTDLKLGMFFVGGLVVCYILTTPVLWLTSAVGLRGGMVERLIAALPICACEGGACFYLARAASLRFVWAWALTGLLNPLVGLLETIGLAVFVGRRFQASGFDQLRSRAAATENAKTD